MKKVLKYIGISIGLYLTVLTCNSLKLKKTSKHSERVSELVKPHLEEMHAEIDIQKATDIMKKQLPLDAGDNILLNNIDYLKEDRVMVYHYKSIDLILEELAEEDIEDYKIYWRNNAINTAKESQNSNSFIKAKVSFYYILYDMNDKEILSFVIDSKEFS